MIPLPLRDENPTTRRPLVVPLIIVANVALWFFELSHGLTESLFDYGAIPAWVLHGIRDGMITISNGGESLRVALHQEVPQPLSVLTSMFMHGSWMHIIGNMWFLWIFGDNVEDAMGRPRFTLFYLLCGVIAALSQILAMPQSEVPMIGASGAIAGVLGAYLILYPRAQVRCLWILIIFVTTIDLPAWLLLGLWFLSQFLIPMGAGVAWMAHVGGFLAGVLLVSLFTRGPRFRPRPEVRVPRYRWSAWN